MKKLGDHLKQGTTIITLDNGYHLWTNTQGQGDIQLLCLHGGPGGNHEYWENFGEELADLGVQVLGEPAHVSLPGIVIPVKTHDATSPLPAESSLAEIETD